MSDIETTIHNERIKLAATWLNGLSVATFAVGGLARGFRRCTATGRCRRTPPCSPPFV